MKELAIGEELRIRCVETKNISYCEKCFFFDDDFNCDGRYCIRKDGKHVYFELVEN